MAGLDFGGLISSVLNTISKYWWIIAVISFIGIMIGIVYWFSRVKKKKTQWTHTIKVRRLLQNGNLTEEVVHRARRFPLEKGVEMFELEKPILGSYLMPQPGEYVGLNEFSIILDAYNRIWLNKGYIFDKDKQSVNVSVVHAGIDVEMSAMKDKWQQAHKVEKKITNLELLKAGIKIIGIIAIVIIAIVALQQWGKAQEFKAQEAQSNAQAMSNLADALKTSQSTVNTQQLQITPMLRALYGESNVAGEVTKYCPTGNVTNGN